MASVQHDNKLYIQGGYSTTNYTPQLDAIDLSQSWSTSAPVWYTLKDGAPISHHALVSVTGQHAKGLGPSNAYILSIAGDGAPSFWSAFDLATGTWNSLTDIVAPYPQLQGHSAVMDPGTGYIYVIGGYTNNATYNAMTVFDPATKTILSQQAATAANSLTDIGAIWSSSRKSILTFGGSRAPPGASSGLDLSTINEYDPSTSTWKPVVTSGNIPTRRLDHCMAASADGSKIVLFGGSLDSKTYFSTIYIFDVKTLEWTLGQPAADFRTRMACGFRAGQFVAWGGSSGDNRVTTMHTNVPIIYDLALNTWVEKFNPDAPEVPTGQPPPPSTTPPSSSTSPSADTGSKKSNGPMIGGVVVGTLVLIAGLIFLCVYLKRKRRDRREKAYARAVASSIAGDDDDRPYANNPLYMNMCQNNTDDSNFGKKVLAGAYLQDSKSSLPEQHYTSVEPLRTNRQRFESPSSSSTDTFVGTGSDDYIKSAPLSRSRPNSESIQDYARRSNIAQSSGGTLSLSSTPLPPPDRPRQQQRSSGNYKPLSPPISPFESGLNNPGRSSLDHTHHQGPSFNRSGFGAPGKQSLDYNREGGSKQSLDYGAGPSNSILRPPENQQQAPYRPMRESLQAPPPRPPRESLDMPSRPREALQPFRPRGDPFYPAPRPPRESPQPQVPYQARGSMDQRGGYRQSYNSDSSL
ncbi:hypothetical protein EC968_003174 [Mortierella alpina]|nr:hypothetical protein EC968_003174 [Mortierella alpina]